MASPTKTPEVQVETLIIGAGMSGLAVANFTRDDDYLILDREAEIGGYCRTVTQDGFVWDYSGHFFHFRRPEIERYLVDRMPPGTVKTVTKCAKIRFKDVMIDFPFQKNIHQLPREDFIDCLHDLFFRDKDRPIHTFNDMLYAKFGKGISERFLVPYNEKLYATDLNNLDADAMGRFFPHADLEEIIRNFKTPDNASYNATFTYPTGGAIDYVRALNAQVPDEKLALSEAVVSIDLDHRVATTDKRTIGYRRLISSAPLDKLLTMTRLGADPQLFTYNRVLVFNLGFDRKGWVGPHWVYFPERKYCFYRVGFYDNIFESDRMSLYVEIGLSKDSDFDPDVDVDRYRRQVLEGLRAGGVVDEHELVSHHWVLLDPAYVHINNPSQAEVRRQMAALNEHGVYSIGRYGGWKYCAIEDNIIEAMALVERLEGHTVTL